MMEIYSTLSSKKNAELAIIDEKISSALSLKKTALDDYFRQFLFNGAKRLRPLFGLFLCDLLNTKADDEILNYFAGIELLHSASLIHDDILDEAQTRRANPCLHRVKTEKQAVLAGDYLLFLALDFILKSGNTNLLKIVSKAGYTMIQSEISSLEKRHVETDLDACIKASKEKTSTLFIALLEGVCEIKKMPVKKEILEFTENFSLIFQIKDDLNNAQGRDKNKTSSDKENGVCTVPLKLGVDKTSVFLDDLFCKTESLLCSFENKNDLLSLLKLFIRK